ncbi:MAG: NADH:ubiquinone reductase (Na(+)-transporting) subunit B [Prevotellaceae bacterium]|jgi:Na+-transporting NADH:ubiquinone oxidoreductase subunit B|nr:NADH:ubiquinone reductase (Na(+)-transporting) subunit B [Prevotellaceae bacterium]
MKSLRKLLDKAKPSFEEGGKLSKFRSVFDGFETFLYVPNTVTRCGSHIRDAMDMKRTMSVVVLALVPCLLFGMWNAGYQHFLSIGNPQSLCPTFWFGFCKVFPIVVVSYVVGLGIEFAVAQVRKHEINEGFLVSGMLIPLVMPVDVPLWMVAVATAFAVIIGKEIFGGTGMNIWNPALLARAFVFFSYPSHISGDKIWVADLSKGQGIIDGFSGATPLAKAAAASPGTAIDLPSACDMFFGFIPGSIGETSKLAILIGAVILIATGVGSWKIMLSCIIGTLATGYLFNVLGGDNPYMSLPPHYHLLMGGLAFGLVFMATDPVSSSQTETGKWIYGFLIGLLVVVIRLFNPAYPEGTMLVILLMNTFAPLIDYYVVGANIRRRLKRAKAALSAIK